MKIFDKLSEISKRRNNSFDDPTKGFGNATRNILIVLACVLLVGSVGLYTYLAYSNGSLYNFFVGEENTTTSQTTTSYTAPEVSGGANVLISVTTDGASDVQLFFILGFDMNKKVISCINLPTETYTTSNKSLADSFKVGNTAQVLIGAEDTLGIKIDRFAQITKSDFIDLIDTFAGSVDVDIDEKVSSSSTDYSLSLQTGPNSLNAEDFVNLLRYDGWSGGIQSTCKHREQYLINAVKSIVTKSFYEGGSDNFSSLIGFADDTNITTDDYSKAEPCISVLANTAWRSNSLSINATAGKNRIDISDKTVNEIKKVFGTYEK